MLQTFIAHSCVEVTMQLPSDTYVFFFLIFKSDQLFLKKIIYLIYLVLAALGLRCCAWAFSSCGEWGLLFIAVHGLLIAVASLVAEHGLQACGLQQLQHAGSVVLAHGLQQLWHMGSVVVACGLQQLWRTGSVVVACGLQSTGSVVKVHGLSSCVSWALERRLSSCGSQAQQLWLSGSRTQAQQLWCTGLVAPQHVGSSRTRARTRAPCIGRWILNHYATREAQTLTFLFLAHSMSSAPVEDPPVRHTYSRPQCSSVSEFILNSLKTVHLPCQETSELPGIVGSPLRFAKNV